MFLQSLTLNVNEMYTYIHFIKDLQMLVSLVPISQNFGRNTSVGKHMNLFTSTEYDSLYLLRKLMVILLSKLNKPDGNLHTQFL